jgi:hypothetical protein
MLLIVEWEGFFTIIVDSSRRNFMGSPPFDLVISDNSIRVCVILIFSMLCTLDISREIISISWVWFRILEAFTLRKEVEGEDWVWELLFDSFISFSIRLIPALSVSEGVLGTCSSANLGSSSSSSSSLLSTCESSKSLFSFSSEVGNNV